MYYSDIKCNGREKYNHNGAVIRICHKSLRTKTISVSPEAYVVIIQVASVNFIEAYGERKAQFDIEEET